MPVKSGGVTDSCSEPNFVTGASYAAFGGLTSAVNGSATGFAGITTTDTFNKRLQPVLLSSASPSQTVFSLSYDFHLGTADNGNVYAITNNRDGNRTQNILYDSLNRIQQAYTNGPNWGETFGPIATSPGVPPATPGIDAWGNLTNRSGVIGKTNYEPLNAPATNLNRLTGFGYDAAGNMTSNGSATYTYDAENELISTAGWTYVYDGDGHRVKKVNGSSGTLYWPDLSGNVLNESSLGATNLHEYVYFAGMRVARIDVPTPLTVKYYFSDHLGSASVITDASGNILKESDYYPYGGEIAISGSDTNNYKYNGKERDTESGLDDFGARYDTSSLGRFMTADWAAKPTDVPYANFGNPQSLNLYSYVENNPTTLGDPDGHGADEPNHDVGPHPACASAPGGGCSYAESQLYASEHADAKAAGQTNVQQAQNQSDPTVPPPPPTPDPAGVRTDPALNPDSSTSSSSSTPSSPSDQTQAPMESRGQQGRRGRGKTAKPDKPPKGVKPNPAKPDQWLEWNKHKGAWVPKPPGWKPETQKKMEAATQGAVGGAIVGTGLGLTAAEVGEILIGVAIAF